MDTIIDTIQSLPQDTLVVAILYLGLSAVYLLIMPGFVYFYLNSRWYVASSPERVFMYFLMFLFFPGVLLLSPFLNFRPKRRQVNSIT